MHATLNRWRAEVSGALSRNSLVREQSAVLRAASMKVKRRAMVLHEVSVRICHQRWPRLVWVFVGGSDNGPAPLTDGELLECARDAIISGKLPPRTSFRTWGGPSVGSGSCGICERTIRKTELAYEIEFADDGVAGRMLQLHIPCFLVWQRERKKW